MIGARAALALYVALAVHLLALLLLLLAPSPQAPTGAGQGLGLGLPLAGPEDVLAPAIPLPREATRVTLQTRPDSARVTAEARSRINREAFVAEAPLPSARPGLAQVSMAPERAGGGVGGYFARLRQHLHRFRRDLAVGPEAGRAEVALVVESDGRVSDLRLTRRSHSRVLDEEALALVLRAQPLPRPADGVVVRLVVPIYVDP